MYKSVEMEAVQSVVGSLWNTLLRLCILGWSWWLQKGMTRPLHPPPELNLVFINYCLTQEVLGLNICKLD